MTDHRGSVRDGFLLSIGTLTALRVPAPRTVDRRSAAIAMTVAPLAVVPLAVLAGAVGWAGTELELTPWAVAVAMVIVLALGSRALHLDGLSDVADGLTAGHDRGRSLEVMKDSAAGPAGAAALVLTLGLQTAALGGLLLHDQGPWLATFLICVSRAILALACMRGVRPARGDGLAVSFAQTIPRPVAAAVWIIAAAGAAGVFTWSGDIDWWRGPVCVAVGLVVAAVVIGHCVRRFGGVTGDVFGATIEISLAAMMLVA